MILPKVGERYKHYKGGEYEIVGYAHHTETDEKMILYKPLYRCADLEDEYPDGVVFSRPYSLFCDEVKYENKTMSRFINSTEDTEVTEPVFVAKEGQTDYTNIRWAPVINCVLVFEGQILIVERSKGMRLYPEYWNGVSGFLDDQKSLEEKVREELNEETGLSEEHINSITLCAVFNQEDASTGKTWIVHAVRVDVTTDDLTFDWETQDHRWLSKEEALQYKLLPGFAEVLDATV